MMTTRKIEKTDWKTYFDEESVRIEGTAISLELTAPDLGDQTEVEWLPLRGMSYDPRQDRLDVITDGLDHAVAHPETVFVSEENGVLLALEINDSQKQSHILTFRRIEGT